jgi:hypothetical protein
MGRTKRSAVEIAGDRESRALAATLGRELRITRRHRRQRLQDTGRTAGISVARLSEIERGLGDTVPLRTWVRLGIAIERPLAVRFSPSIEPDRLADAGHLEMQEWVLRLARRRGWTAGLEIPTRPSDPRHSVDVLVRAGSQRVIIECWNTIGDFGAAIRSTNRKIAEAGALGGAGTTTGVWLVRATASNRAIVRAYPEAMRSRFPGSSRSWVEALEGRRPPPAELGIVWLDPTRGASPLRLRA